MIPYEPAVCYNRTEREEQEYGGAHCAWIDRGIRMFTILQAREAIGNTAYFARGRAYADEGRVQQTGRIR